jgi:tRNA pseudouridine55 synthase
MDGFLNLAKTIGWTSHDCVAKVRRLLNQKKVGHGGTLDPAATGVLPIALGRATRLLQYLPTDKAYEATIRLGITTTTDDLQGQTLTETPAAHLTLPIIEAILPEFIGSLTQIPPRYSAIQVQGKRLYDLARTDQVFEVPARTVVVYNIQVLDWRSGDFPELDVAIACGGGTYIRAIARDLGEKLGVGGTLAKLVRTQSAGFGLAGSLSLETLTTQVQTGTFQPIDPTIPLQHLPQVNLSPDAAKRWCQGQKIAGESVALAPNLLGSAVVVRDADDRFLGIGVWQNAKEENGEMILAPKVNFLSDPGFRNS